MSLLNQKWMRVPDLSLTEPKFLSLVLPTYNEYENIDLILTKLTEILTPCLGDDYELIVVDDNSPDGTFNVANLRSKNDARIRAFKREKDKGLSSAVIFGWKQATGKHLGVIDADLQHPPEVIQKMVATLQENPCDLIVASRHMEGGGVSENWGWLRQFISNGASTLTNIFIPKIASRISDPMSGCFIVKRDALIHCALNPLGYKILLEVVGRSNVENIQEVPYVFRERDRGGSKMTAKIYWQFIKHLFALKFFHTK